MAKGWRWASERPEDGIGRPRPAPAEKPGRSCPRRRNLNSYAPALAKAAGVPEALPGSPTSRTRAIDCPAPAGHQCRRLDAAASHGRPQSAGFETAALVA